MSDVTLPSAQAALVGQGGLAQRYFYRWLQATDDRIKDGAATGAGNVEAIKEIAIKLGSPDGSVDNIPPQGNSAIINGSGSIQVDGTLANGVVNLSLMYDTLYPGATTYYGSDSSGNRGWFPVSDALDGTSNVVLSTNTSTGVTSFDLSDLSNSGVGSLVGITRDAKGRVAGTRSVIPGDGIGIADNGSSIVISLVGLPIYLVDESGNQLVDESGNFLVDTATVGLPIPFANVTDTPTTLAGYGITDAQKSGNPVAFPIYTLATLPSAATNQWKAIVVTDLTGGAEPCLSDGTNWRRFSDRSIAS